MMDSVAECERWLTENTATDQTKAKKDTLEKINKIKSLKENSKVILIAGTNGKGTTAMLLERLLQGAGYRVGSFISPHLCYLNERVRVAGTMVSNEQFCRSFAQMKTICSDIAIHWFGFLLLVALNIFKSLPLDFLVIEVGIGGKADLTNTLEPTLSIITTIALDHMELLGTNREEIGSQKAGIFRAQKAAICGDPQPPRSLLEQADTLGTTLWIQGKDFNYQQQQQQWSWQGFGQSFTQLPRPHMPLQNASTALAAYCALGMQAKMDETMIHTALRDIVVAGRYQTIAHQPTVICDVAHNPQAVAYLVNQLNLEQCVGKTLIVLAMKMNKAIESVLAEVSLPVSAWFLADLTQEEGFVQQAAGYLQPRQQVIYQAASVVAAFKKAEAIATENDRIVVFGSFRTVQQVLLLFPMIMNRIN